MALPIDKSYLLTQLRNFKSVILDPAYIIQKTTLPTANASNEGKVFQYIGTDSTNYTIGGFYQCQEVTPVTDPVTYTWTEVSTKTLIDDETIKRNTTTKELYVPKATASTVGAVKPGSGLAVDTAGSLRVVARLEEISELPTATAALEGKCYILVADQTGYTIGNVYQCQSDGAVTPTYSWVTINKGFDDNFVGTLAQWNALTAAEKVKYKTADITDDFNGSPVDDALSDTSSNPVQNRVVKAAFDSRDNDLAERAILKLYTISTGTHTISNVTNGDLFIFVRNANGIIAISHTGSAERIVELSAVTDVLFSNSVLSFTRTSQYSGEVLCLTRKAVTVI